MSNRVFNFAFFVLLLLAQAACSSTTADQRPSPVEEQAASVPKAIPVEVSEIRMETLSETLELTGTVQPWDEFSVSSEIAGKVASILQEEGAWVKAGELLVGLDRTKRELELESRKAEVKRIETEAEFARKRLARGRILLEQGAISEADVDALSERVDLIDSEMKIAQVAVERVAEELLDTRIFAPAAGQISQRHVSLGEIVGPQSPLMTIIQTDPVKVITEITEPYLHIFHKGTEVELRFAAIAGQEFRGRIHRIHPVSNPKSGAFPTEIRLENPENRLQPGMLARLRLKGKSYPDSLVVPLEAIVNLDGSDYLYVVEEKNARRIPILVLERIGAAAIIKGEVRPGQMVVTRGNFNLTDGTSVAVVSP